MLFNSPTAWQQVVVRVMADAQEALVTREHFDAKLETLEARLDAKIDKLPWMMGILIAFAVVNFTKQFFLPLSP